MASAALAITAGVVCVVLNGQVVVHLIVLVKIERRGTHSRAASGAHSGEPGDVPSLCRRRTVRRRPRLRDPAGGQPDGGRGRGCLRSADTSESEEREEERRGEERCRG